MSKNWIQGAIKHPGALTATAERHHAVTKGGTIDADWLQKAAGGAYGDKTAKRANLAITLKHLHK